MKKFGILLIICLSMFWGSGFAGEFRPRPSGWAFPIISQNLSRWFRVDALVYRSEQPNARAMKEMERFGIKRVLSLRRFHTDADEAASTRLKLFRVPMDAGDVNDEAIAAALKIVVSSDEPVLIHCWHGSDRTGAVIAMYRIVVQGWSKEAAIDEMVNGGYGFHSVYDNIIEYIRGVNVEEIKRRIATL